MPLFGNVAIKCLAADWHSVFSYQPDLKHTPMCACTHAHTHARTCEVGCGGRPGSYKKPPQEPFLSRSSWWAFRSFVQLSVNLKSQSSDSVSSIRLIPDTADRDKWAAISEPLATLGLMGGLVSGSLGGSFTV